MQIISKDHRFNHRIISRQVEESNRILTGNKEMISHTVKTQANHELNINQSNTTTMANLNTETITTIKDTSLVTLTITTVTTTIINMTTTISITIVINHHIDNRINVLVVMHKIINARILIIRYVI